MLACRVGPASPLSARANKKVRPALSHDPGESVGALWMRRLSQGCAQGKPRPRTNHGNRRVR